MKRMIPITATQTITAQTGTPRDTRKTRSHATKTGSRDDARLSTTMVMPAQMVVSSTDIHSQVRR